MVKLTWSDLSGVLAPIMMAQIGGSTGSNTFELTGNVTLATADFNFA